MNNFFPALMLSLLALTTSLHAQATSTESANAALSVETYAGSSEGFLNGPTNIARFNFPHGLAIAPDGRVFVGDTFNNRIRVISADGSNVSTFASGVNVLVQLAIGSDGRIFVSEFFNGQLKVISADGSNVTTLASGLNNPQSVAVAPDGRVFFGDASGRIFVLNADGTNRSTFASGFSSPEGIAISSDGRVFVAETLANRIRVISADGSNVSTLPGTYNRPRGVTVTRDGRVFISDTGNHRIQVISADGLTVSTYAGSGVEGFADGSTSTAQFNDPIQLALDANGRLLFADRDNHRIRVISAPANEEPSDLVNSRISVNSGLLSANQALAVGDVIELIVNAKGSSDVLVQTTYTLSNPIQLRAHVWPRDLAKHVNQLNASVTIGECSSGGNKAACDPNDVSPIASSFRNLLWASPSLGEIEVQLNHMPTPDRTTASLTRDLAITDGALGAEQALAVGDVIELIVNAKGSSDVLMQTALTLSHPVHLRSHVWPKLLANQVNQLNTTVAIGECTTGRFKAYCNVQDVASIGSSYRNVLWSSPSLGEVEVQLNHTPTPDRTTASLTRDLAITDGTLGAEQALAVGDVIQLVVSAKGSSDVLMQTVLTLNNPVHLRSHVWPKLLANQVNQLNTTVAIGECTTGRFKAYCNAQDVASIGSSYRNVLWVSPSLGEVEIQLNAIVRNVGNSSLNITASVGQLLFSWPTDPIADFYRVQINPTGVDGFIPLSTPSQSLKTTNFTFGISLSDHINLATSNVSFLVESCIGNPDGNNNCIQWTAQTRINDLNQLIGFIKANNAGYRDRFETVSISRDGKTLAVSALSEDSSGRGVNARQDQSRSNSGAAYVFTQTATGLWTQQAFLKASNADINDYFGNSLSLSSDGNTLAVGAIGERSLATGVNGDENNNSASHNAGAAYVFVRSASGTWSQQAYIKASNTEVDDQFAASIALSGDGNTLAVGALYEDGRTGGINGDQSNEANNFTFHAGAAYVYTRNSSTQWTQQAYIKAHNPSHDNRFGVSVSLDDDGNTLVVGSMYEGSNSTGVANGIDDIVINGPHSINFAGAAYVYTRSITGVWSQQAFIKPNNTGVGDRFGFDVSLSADGNTLAVASESEDSSGTGVNPIEEGDGLTDSGAVFIYARNKDSLWGFQAYIKASNPTSNDRFGHSVSLSGDGNMLAVGAPFEDSRSIGLNGIESDESGSDVGAVYTFIRSGSVWSQQAYIKPTRISGFGDHFGFSLSFSGDGSRLAIGAPLESSGAFSEGAAYLY